MGIYFVIGIAGKIGGARIGRKMMICIIGGLVEIQEGIEYGYK